jgi:hypothetical protein
MVKRGLFGFGFVAGFKWGFLSCLRGPLGLSPTIFTWNTRNTARTWMQHIRNDCNMNDKRLHHECDQLQHAKNIIATPIYNCCNIKKAVATSPVRARGGCRSFPAHATMTADDKSSWLRLGTGCTTNGGWGGVTLVRRRG